MENELISNEDLQRIQAQQALHSATSTSLSSFLASTEDEMPVTTEEVINTVSEDIAEHNALVTNIEVEFEENEDEESHPLTDAELGLVPTISTRPLTDEEVEQLASQSVVVATGVGVDEDMDMNELLEAALDELDISPVTPNAVVYDNLPVNSETLSLSETTSRFSSAIWADKIKTKSILLAGIGGIGSYVAYLLSRVNVANLTMIDDDIVEAANLSGQMFDMSSIGQSKVSAMGNILGDFSNFYQYNAVPSRFTENSSSMDIMICGFDNMIARTLFYNAWKRRVNGYSSPESKANCLFIDGRLAAEEYQVFCIKGDDAYNMERYERDFIFTDEEAEATVCSYKQTSFMANQIASTMVNLFVNYVANQCEPLFDRDLPFYTSYDGVTMYFKTEA